MNPNKHNLYRYIDAETARQIRQNAGFGCAICGLAFYIYEHHSPEFHDATEHNANGITLLCGGCEDAKTRGRISVEEVREAALNPKCLQAGFSHGALRFGRKDALIQIGDNKFLNPKKIITINGETILSIASPKDVGEPYLITFIASDKPNGNKIIDNEWFGDVGNWDITTVGRMIEVRDHAKKIILQLENIPDEKFVVHTIDLNYKGYQIATKKISRKRIGHIEHPEENVFTITNTLGQEIFRSGRNGENDYTTDWANGMEVVGEFMKPDLSYMNLTNAKMNYICPENVNVDMSECRLSNIKFKIGLNEELNIFMKGIIARQQDPSPIHKHEQEKFELQYRALKHNGIIKQLMPIDAQNLLPALLTYFKIRP